MILAADSGECVVVDPGFYSSDEKEQFYGYVSDNGLKPVAILITHCHVDHIWGAKELQDRFGIPLYMGPEDVEAYSRYDGMPVRFGLEPPRYDFKVTPVNDGDTVTAAGFTFKVITTPGHSPGGVCFLEENEKVMFTGDSLFAGTIGRTDLFRGDYDSLIKSIMEKIIWLDPDIEILPGHGRPSTIGTERTQNPFLEPFNEKEELEELQHLPSDELAHD